MTPLFLLTDFGLRDPYVGILRAVVASIAPACAVHDLGHELPPQDLRAAAHALSSAVPFVPDGAVVCAVIDPGVGSERLPIAVRLTLAGRSTSVIAPDNGLITPLLEVAEHISAVALDDPNYHLTPVSATFHGRDIFAPAAAHLAAGTPFAQLGSPVSPAALRRIPWPTPVRDGDATIGEVVAVDRFGNLISNLAPDPQRLGPPTDWAYWRVEVAGRELPLRRIYADVGPGAAVAYLGSTGRIEIAVRNGSAAERLALGVGERVRLAPYGPDAQRAGDGSG